MLVAQAVFGIRAGTAGLDPDVRPRDQLLEHLFALGGAGVERDGVRVAVILRVAVVAAGLAGHVRGLDLHDVRAHLGHDARGEGAGDVRARHEHFHARENAELRELTERHMRAVVIFIMRRHSSVSFLSRCGRLHVEPAGVDLQLRTGDVARGNVVGQVSDGVGAVFRLAEDGLLLAGLRDGVQRSSLAGAHQPF